MQLHAFVQATPSPPPSFSSSRPSRIRLEFGLLRRRFAIRSTSLLPFRLVVRFPLRRRLFLLLRSDHDRVLLGAGGSTTGPVRARLDLLLDDSRRRDGFLLLLDERSQVVDLAGGRSRRHGGGRLAEEGFEGGVGCGWGGGDRHGLEVFDLFFRRCSRGEYGRRAWLSERG